MCLGLPARVVAVSGEIAEVEEASGRRRRAGLLLLKGDERPGVGDFVLIHAGLAVGRVSEEEAREASAMLEGFGDLLGEPEGAR